MSCVFCNEILKKVSSQVKNATFADDHAFYIFIWMHIWNHAKLELHLSTNSTIDEKKFLKKQKKHSANPQGIKHPQDKLNPHYFTKPSVHIPMVLYRYMTTCSLPDMRFRMTKIYQGDSMDSCT